MKLSDAHQLSHHTKEDFKMKFNTEILKEIQSAYAKANNIYCICKDRQFQTVAAEQLSIIEEEYLSEHFSVEKQKELFYSFVDDDVENVIEIGTDIEEVMLRGIAIRGNQSEILGVWMIIGVDADKLQDEFLSMEIRRCKRDEYDNSVALLETISKNYFREAFLAQTVQSQLEEIQQENVKKEYQLHKSEVLTEILKMLESENEFSKIAEDILQEAGSYLKVSGCGLFRMNADGITMDMICEWVNDGQPVLLPLFQQIPMDNVPFATGRPYTISSETLIPDNFKDFFEIHNMTAAVFLPLTISGKAGMYLAFAMRGENRKWTVEELRFVNDVKRILQTVLVKRITKNSLASSYAALEAILENAGCGVSINDVRNKSVLYTNETYKMMFEIREDQEELTQILMEDVAEGNKPKEYYSRETDRWYEISFNTIKWVDSRDVRLATIYDITHIKMYQKRIEHQANVDYLTGLYNRMRCEEDLKEYIRSAARTGNQGALLYLDLDDFKNINDGLGHNCGDQLLKEVAKTLQKIKGVGSSCYRIGGDEFAILISHSNYENIEYIKKRIQEIFTRPWFLSGADYYCTMSMGVVSFPKDGVDVETLLQRADIALYSAKQKGKNRIENYSDKTVSSSIKRLDLEKNLREAVADGCKEFEVYYQPIMKISDGKQECCGAEALVRWQSPSLGFLSPYEFVPLSEYLGLIVPIGEYVLNEACDRCKYWNDFGHPEYKVNVNLSVVQLLQNNIVDVVQHAVTRSGITPENLTLEVTEGLAINDMKCMKKVLNDIRAMGVRVALDDFGTGYSSLNHIKNIPLDVIKIDRCFVTELGKDAYSDAFVRSVSELAYAMHVNVCVEGVEDKQQCDTLHDMKIDMLQGYFFDKPLEADMFERKYLY